MASKQNEKARQALKPLKLKVSFSAKQVGFLTDLLEFRSEEYADCAAASFTTAAEAQQFLQSKEIVDSILEEVRHGTWK